MAKKQLGAVDSELLARVDAARGDVSRVRWVERALEAALADADRLLAVGNRIADRTGITDVPPAELARRLEEPHDLKESLRAADEDLRAGRTVPLDELRAELDADPGPTRSCSRCGRTIPSPSLRIHPSCGGKVVPEPV